MAPGRPATAQPRLNFYETPDNLSGGQSRFTVDKLRDRSSAAHRASAAKAELAGIRDTPRSC